MAKARKKTKEKVKSKSVRYYGLNITLQSKERKGKEVYAELLRKIYEDRSVYSVGHDIMMLLRNQFSTQFTYDHRKRDVLYGKILRFNAIKNWYNRKEQLYSSYEAPQDLVPNAFETDYIFIPDAHKFLIRYNNKTNVYQVKTFLEKALRDVTVSTEIVHVSIMTSNDIIETIMDAKTILNLSIAVSYTNDEIGNEAKELMDDLLKDAHAGQAELNFKPDAAGSLDPKSKLIGGLLAVAKNNGNAEATILNANGRRKTIRTEQYPAKINVKVIETETKKEDEKEVVFNQIMNDYKKDEKG